MNNGPKNLISTRQPKPAGYAARPKRWTPNSTRPSCTGLKAPKEATNDILH
jgi:hypothetical protein